MAQDKDERFLTDMLDRGATVIDSSGVHHGSRKRNYKVTTKHTLKGEMTRVRSASHFINACNGIDEESFYNPIDILRRHGFIVDVVTTKHVIIKEK